MTSDNRNDLTRAHDLLARAYVACRSTELAVEIEAELQRVGAASFFQSGAREALREADLARTVGIPV
jgi:hypothetical protein